MIINHFKYMVFSLRDKKTNINRKYIYSFLLITMVFMTLPILLSAQSRYENETIKEKPFDKKTWEKTKRNLDYSGEMSVDEKQKQNEEINLEQEGRRGEEMPDYSDSWINNSFMQGSRPLKILFFTVAIIALAFVLWKIVQTQIRLKNPKVKQRVEDLEQAVENIHESDLERFLREALAADNYKLAIRIYYLMIIKDLSEKQLIKWKKDKTNNAYVREMKKTEHYERFRNITREFEKAWFGEKEIQQTDFQQLQPQFQGFTNSIK